MAATGLTLLSTSLIASAEIDTTLYAGIEEYRWQEYDPQTGAQLMEVTGPRLRVGLNLAPRLQSRIFAFDYDVSMYEGTMDYSSQLTDPGTGASLPFSDRIAYMGADTHLDGIYTGFGERIEPVLTLGYEGWRRSLDSRFISTSVGTMTAPGYAEDWSMFYAKLGARGKLGHFSWTAGFKLPFAVTDSADYLQATTHPTGLVSEYISGDYMFARTWKVGVSYEDTRFGQSDTANSILGPNSVLQPKADEGVFMLSLAKAF